MSKASTSTKINHPIPLEIKQLNRAIVTKSSLIITAKGISPYCLFENLPKSLEKNIKILAYGSLLRNKFRMLRGKNYFSVFNLWGSGYHHWLTEVAIKLVLFEEEIKMGTVLIPKERPQFVEDFISLFDFKTEYFVENLYIRNLKIITNPNSGHYQASDLWKLRDVLFEKLKVKEGKKRKIYISRQNARARKVVNEEELTSYLKKNDFECLDLDRIPFKEQVEIFYNCNHLMSIHGAGLTNCIFMPKGSKITELYPEITNIEAQLSACYYRMSNILGHNHQYLFCRREFPKNQFYLDEENIHVDVSGLVI